MLNRSHGQYNASTHFLSLPLPPALSLQMSMVDPDGALKIYSQNRDWDKCLELASQQGAEVLSKYMALYTAQLICEDKALKALQLFAKHGCSTNPQNFNIYKHLCAAVYQQDLGKGEGYATYSSLRNMLQHLVEELSQTQEAGGTHHKEFEQHLLAAHYLASRAAFQGVEKLDYLVAKLSVSLLRHTSYVPADKAFYEAGTFCRAVKWNSMAFVFFNRFLDLSEVRHTWGITYSGYYSRIIILCTPPRCRPLKKALLMHSTILTSQTQTFPSTFPYQNAHTCR